MVLERRAIKRVSWGALGVLCFALAVLGTIQARGDSKWWIFLVNIALGVAVSVFVWFVTEPLKERLDDLREMAEETRTAVKELLEAIEVEDETEPGRKLDRKIGVAIGSLETQVGMLSRRLTELDVEVDGLLDGVLTALDVRIDDARDRGSRPGPARWQVADGSSSVREMFPTVEALVEIERMLVSVSEKVEKIPEDGAPDVMRNVRNNLNEIQKKFGVLKQSLGRSPSPD